MDIRVDRWTSLLDIRVYRWISLVDIRLDGCFFGGYQARYMDMSVR